MPLNFSLWSFLDFLQLFDFIGMSLPIGHLAPPFHLRIAQAIQYPHYRTFICHIIAAMTIDYWGREQSPHDKYHKMRHNYIAALMWHLPKLALAPQGWESYQVIVDEELADMEVLTAGPLNVMTSRRVLEGFLIFFVPSSSDIDDCSIIMIVEGAWLLLLLTWWLCS